MSGPQHFEVAVVGYGPVGVTLAGLLGRAGIKVCVFDKAVDIYAQPRAVGFDHDAMRIFQGIGAADALAPHVAPFRDGEYYGVGGTLIQRVRRVPPPYPLTWDPNYTCDQPGIESALRGTVAGFGNVHVALGSEVQRATPDEDRVWLDLRDAAGNTERHSASYVVACDGASSPVRRALGIGLEDFEYDEPWIVVDVIVEDAHLSHLPATNVQFCQPERPSTFITCPGNHRRWEFMTLPGEPDAGDVSEERLWKLLSRWLEPGQARIWRAAAYRFHALVAREWRRGRILLAGDAAHMTPPFLGQGMCQGLRDAGNLAWKLAQVVRGRAPAALLDTYTAERRPHVVETTRLAKEFGRIISERDPKAALARDARMLDTPDGAPRTLYRQDLIPGLATGLIAAGAPLAGKVFPQPLVWPATADAGDRPTLFDDLTPPSWRLVLAGDLDTDARRMLVALAHRYGVTAIVVGAAAHDDGAMHVRESDALLGRWLEAAVCIGVLVRPDHYVWGGFTAPDAAVRILEQWVAHPAMQAP
jgi:3-(3-hydroxy-phenyl)propionate hydroxylase